MQTKPPRILEETKLKGIFESVSKPNQSNTKDPKNKNNTLNPYKAGKKNNTSNK